MHCVLSTLDHHLKMATAKENIPEGGKDSSPPANQQKGKKRIQREPLQSTKKRKIVYTSEVRDGWIHCRVPVKTSPLYDFGLNDATVSDQKGRMVSPPGELYKDKRYPCPDCKKWYGNDENHIQRSCRHRVRSETDEELKMWDISFSDDDC